MIVSKRFTETIMRSNLDRRAPLRAWWPRVAGQVDKTPPAPDAKEAPHVPHPKDP
jgi:hypothetical protein